MAAQETKKCERVGILSLIHIFNTSRFQLSSDDVNCGILTGGARKSGWSTIAEAVAEVVEEGLVVLVAAVPVVAEAGVALSATRAKALRLC